MHHTPANGYEHLDIDPRLIRPNPWNTNIVSHENELKIQESLKRHGFFRPVVVRETDNLPRGEYQSLGGWHRVEQATDLGFETVPVINLGPISDARAKEISLLDNARYGHDDALGLAQLVKDLDGLDLAMVMPWAQSDLDGFTASLSVNVEDLDLDDAPLAPDDLDKVEQAPTKEPKTHDILRFKVSLQDAARARAIVGGTMKAQGFSHADDLTNAGDALMHILLKEDPNATPA